jgi:hypothetical protein
MKEVVDPRVEPGDDGVLLHAVIQDGRRPIRDRDPIGERSRRYGFAFGRDDGSHKPPG